MKKIKILLFFVVILGLLSACGSSASSLAGEWKAEKLRLPAGHAGISEIEFFSDGTYTSDHPNYCGSYSVDKNRIRLSGDLVDDATFTFDIKGKTLTFYTELGSEIKFNKVN